VREAENLTANCVPIFWRMWEPRRFTTLWAFMACWSDSFTFTFRPIHRCLKSLEPMLILVIILIFIYRLKLEFKRLKVTLTLDERVEIVLRSGRQGWTQRQVAVEFNARHRERNTVTHSAVGKHGKAAEKMCIVSG
jgi:hypothetical protein